MEGEKCEQVEVEKCEEVAEEKCEVVEEMQCKVEEKEVCEELVEEVCNQVRTCHLDPGCAIFVRDFFRWSVFGIMTKLMGSPKTHGVTGHVGIREF